MQTIGERLEEARKRKGISLREAAEATKIRSDFLTSIEENKFDFDLPDLYKRGFLKNYARYLKLDTDKLLADFSAQQLSHARSAKRGGSEWFGQMELDKKEAPEDSPEPETSAGGAEDRGYGRLTANAKRAEASEPLPEPNPQSTREVDGDDKFFYIKIGLVFVGTLALVFVVFGLIRAVLGGGDASTAAEPDMRGDASAVVGEAGGTSVTAPGQTDTESPSQITLEATGNVYVLVRQRENDEVLYRDTLSAGDSVPLDKQGPVDVLFTAGENLVIQAGDERVRPSASGTAKIAIP